MYVFCVLVGFKFDCKVIYGDTDSIMILFGVPTLEEAFELGIIAEAIVNAAYDRPIKIELEKAFKTYLLMCAKRYIGSMYVYYFKTDSDGKHIIDPETGKRIMVIKFKKIDKKGIQGVRRDNCVKSGTPVALSTGLSVPIEETQVDCTVRSWTINEETDQPGLNLNQCSHVLNQGIKECIRLTFEDGRTLVCTPEHRIMVSNNTWVEAKDLVIGQSEVQVGPDTPLDIKYANEHNWKLTTKTMIFRMDTESERNKTLAMARILGYAMTDGSFGISKTGQKSCAIYIGHEVDVESIVNDIFTITGIRPSSAFSSNVWRTKTPAVLTHAIFEIMGGDSCAGRRAVADASTPCFVDDASTPLSVLREWVAGLFGGDGMAPALCRDGGENHWRFNAPRLTNSKEETHAESLKILWVKVVKILERFNITSTMPEPDEYFAEEDGILLRFLSVKICLSENDILKFAETIGFRHCAHKSQRLAAASAWYRLRENVMKQTIWFQERVAHISDYNAAKLLSGDKRAKPKVPIHVACKQSVVEMNKFFDVILAPHSIPSRRVISQIIQEGRVSDTRTLSRIDKNDTYVNAMKFLESIGADHYFVDKSNKTQYSGPIKTKNKDQITGQKRMRPAYGTEALGIRTVQYGIVRGRMTLPTFKLKVLARVDAGFHSVYDLSVENDHSFTANGIVVHNCVLAANLQTQSIETLFDETLENSSEKAIKLIKDSIALLYSGRMPMSKLVISKALSKSIDDPSYRQSQFHVHLAHLMRKRDPSKAPKNGDRVPFVVKEKVGHKGRKVKNYEKAEDPMIALFNRDKIDVKYYVEKQLTNAISCVFIPIMGEQSVKTLFDPPVSHHAIKKYAPKISEEDKKFKMSILSFVKTSNKCVNKNCGFPLSSGTKGGLCESCVNSRSSVVLTLRAAYNKAKAANQVNQDTCMKCKKGNLTLIKNCRKITSCDTFSLRTWSAFDLKEARQALVDIEDIVPANKVEVVQDSTSNALELEDENQMMD